MRELEPDAALSVFSKNDRAGIASAFDLASRFTAVGDWSLPERTVVWMWKLFWAACRERPDLIVVTHANFTPVAGFVKKLIAVPYLAVGHGIEVWGLQNKSAGPGLRGADRLVAVSDFTRQRMSEALAILPDRIGILPNTFEADHFALGPKPDFLLRRYGLEADQPVVLSIGRLAKEERYKGYDLVLKVLLEVRKAFPEVRYILGGNGPDSARLDSLIQKLGIQETVTLTGHIPEEELSAHYNLCDVFAMPSKGEGFGIVFLEALACGKPVIAGNKDGSVDALAGGELGVLVDPDDPQALTEALVAVLSEVESRKSKVQGKSRTSDISSPFSGLNIPEIVFQPEELRRRVIEEFGFERFKQRLSEILAPLLESGK